jgi:hypothetical protein
MESMGRLVAAAMRELGPSRRAAVGLVFPTSSTPKKNQLSRLARIDDARKRNSAFVARPPAIPRRLISVWIQE